MEDASSVPRSEVELLLQFRDRMRILETPFVYGHNTTVIDGQKKSWETLMKHKNAWISRSECAGRAISASRCVVVPPTPGIAFQDVSVPPQTFRVDYPQTLVEGVGRESDYLSECASWFDESD